MKKSSIFFACLIALVAISVWAPPAEAYETYSVNRDATNCQKCHGNYRTSPYNSLTGDGSWGDDLHDVHRRTMLGGDCDACHNASGRFPVYLDSSTGGTGLEAISCMGCHGREEDNTVTSGSGAGLRQHHWRAGEQGCLDCHDDANPANFTPVGEEILPPYYLADDPDHPLIPSDPCNPSADGFPENYAASNLGLDNDGNGLYDGEDLMACLAKGDVNGSGVADLADVILSLQVAGGMTPAGIIHKEADINNDQKVGIPEAVWIMSNSGR